MNAAVPKAWQAVDVGPADAPRVQALFAEVFGPPMPAALWHWKYGDGRGMATGARELLADGALSPGLLAHCGGTQRVLWCGGQPLAAVQLGDVMVQARARGVLSRQGPFVVTVRRFLDSLVGDGRAFASGFGFPNERHVRLGQVLGLYQPVAPMVDVNWPAAGAAVQRRARWRWRVMPLDWGSAATPAQLDGLWRRLLQDTPGREWVLGQRDAAWWRHRFANHPQAPYACLWVRGRWSGRLLGAVALRPAAAAGAPWELLDWLCAPRDMGAVLGAAWALCGARGAGLCAWLSVPLLEQVRAAAPDLDAAARVQSACMAVSAGQVSWAAVAAGLPTRPWWLTGGDTDFR